MDNLTGRRVRLSVVNDDDTARIARLTAARWHAEHGAAMCAYPSVAAAHQLAFDLLSALDSVAPGSTAHNPPRPSS